MTALKKTVSMKYFFFQVSQNPLRKRKVYKTKVVIQNSAVKCYYEFHVRSQKNLDILILVALFLLLKKVILYWPYVRIK